MRPTSAFLMDRSDQMTLQKCRYASPSVNCVAISMRAGISAGELAVSMIYWRIVFPNLTRWRRSDPTVPYHVSSPWQTTRRECGPASSYIESLASISSAMFLISTGGFEANGVSPLYHNPDFLKTVVVHGLTPYSLSC